MSSSTALFEKHLCVNSTTTNAIALLEDNTSLSKARIKQAMQKGAVWLERGKQIKRLRRADKVLQLNDQLHFYYNERLLEQKPAHAELIADEGSYSIWYKPYGMLCQGSRWGDHCTIYRWAEQHLEPQRPAFIVHRLDRAASGLIVIAHQKKTAAYFSALFQQRKITKRYQAMVSGEFPEKITLTTPIDGKPSISHIKRLDYSDQQSLLEVQIETGRKHQIRRHLSEYGFPIIGDRLYGEQNSESGSNLQLVSCHLSFISPNGENSYYSLSEKYLITLDN